VTPAPRISIVVPNLDSPWIDGTLTGLAEQGAPGEGVEVVVVGRDLPGLVPRDGGVRLHETERPLPPAAARNLGVAAARGEHLLFIDADCRPLYGWLATIRRALDRAPIVGGAVTFPLDSDCWSLADNIASFHELMPDRRGEAATDRPLGSLNLAVRREAWEAVGPFDEELVTSEDLDWVLRARHTGLATAFEPQARVEHAAVRNGRRALEEHARWYGSHFQAFCARHPGLLDRGPTWRSRHRLAAAAPAKSLLAALRIFLAHRSLWGRPLRAFPGVVRFKLAWYRAIVDTWEGERP